MVSDGTWPRWCRTLVLGLLSWPWLVVQAETHGDPPARVGRLLPLQGEVWVLDTEAGRWEAASHNQALTGGDRVATGAGARAELRVGSSVLRLTGGSEIEVQRLDDAGMAFELLAGSLALNTRSDDVAEQTRVVTGEATLRLLRSGSYRFDRRDGSTLVASQRGELLVDIAGGWLVGSGRRIEIWREAGTAELRQAWVEPANDEFANWIASADRDDERAPLSSHVSPEMTGIEDLDRHGHWGRHPEHGVVWWPRAVAPGWAPYRHGRWAWVRPWGWTWVDAAPWGFAPFHYGRWVSWQGRWCWAPGPRLARPVWGPVRLPPHVARPVAPGGALPRPLPRPPAFAGPPTPAPPVAVVGPRPIPPPSVHPGPRPLPGAPAPGPGAAKPRPLPVEATPAGDRRQIPRPPGRTQPRQAER